MINSAGAINSDPTKPNNNWASYDYSDKTTYNNGNIVIYPAKSGAAQSYKMVGPSSITGVPPTAGSSNSNWKMSD